MARQPVTILIPCNDNWEELERTFNQLDPHFAKVKRSVKILVLDNASDRVLPNGWPLKGVHNRGYRAIRSVDVLRFRQRYNNQRLVSHGLRYVHQHRKGCTVLVLETDGHQEPQDIAKSLIAFEKKNRGVMIAEAPNRRDQIVSRALDRIYDLPAPATKPALSVDDSPELFSETQQSTSWRIRVADRLVEGLVSAFCLLVEFSDHATALLLTNRHSLPRFVRLRDARSFIHSETEAYRKPVPDSEKSGIKDSKEKVLAAAAAQTATPLAPEPIDRPTDPWQLQNLIAAVGTSSGDGEPKQVRDWIMNPPKIPAARAQSYFHTDRNQIRRSGMANPDTIRQDRS